MSLFLMTLCAGAVHAAPDEDKLGKAQGYPVGTRMNWFTDESVRVGSFTHQAEIDGIQRGGVNALQPSARPMPLPQASREPVLRWNVDQYRNLTVDDYLDRQRVMGLMIIKDGVVQVERYQYGRTAQDRFLSNSMSKSIVALAIGMAVQEGLIASLDERADHYAPKIAGTLYGETTIRNLLRMASGARFTERYDGKDDMARFGTASGRDGLEAAARVVTERDFAQGVHFNYASAETAMLGAVLRGATGGSLSDYLSTRLWQPIGAETSALWRTDKTGLEVAAGNFNATLRDYARLAIVLANDGVRPDDPAKAQIIPREFLLDATDWQRVPEAFRPGQAAPYYGYGYKFWLFPGKTRRFAMLGVYGQMIFIDPGQKLVMVQTSANATAKTGQTTLARDADAFWRGVVQHYGTW